MRIEEVESYFSHLEERIKKEFEIASRAREKGFDPELKPEIIVTRDYAERVEKLLNLPGIAEEIRKLEAEGKNREEIAMTLADRIVLTQLELNDEKVAEKALRLALAIITEAVPIAAVIEGLAKVEIRRDTRSRWLALHFASPIRAAGGTAAALTILIGDLIRRKLHLDKFVPTPQEIERYVEETELYADLEHLQYTPSPDEVRLAVANIPVEVTGEPTHKDVTVTTNRGLERVGHDFVRGGAILALAEGVIQKAPKLLKYVEKLNLDGWEWLEEIAHHFQAKESKEREEIPETEETEEIEEEADEEEERYLQEVIGGRPVFSHPQRQGGFRVRYGRARNTGYATVGMHPATMVILGGFPAVGTQLKTEFPGKAATIAPVDTIEGPTVKLSDGSVVRIRTLEEARRLKDEVIEILSLGDLLISFGEFLENNHPLLPPCWCEEWWAKELKKRGADSQDLSVYLEPPYPPPPPELAIELSEKYGVPLHPYYTFDFQFLNKEELSQLIKWFESARIIREGNKTVLELQVAPAKKFLEQIGVPHRVEQNKVIIEEFALPLIRCLGLENHQKYEILEKYTEVLTIVEKIAGLPLRQKTTALVGTRMGRPEKASPRKMKPPPHILFPVSTAGGPTRSIVKAASSGVPVIAEIVHLRCPNCQRITIRKKCENCGSETEYFRSCPVCNREINEERCRIHGERVSFASRRMIPLREMLENALRNLEEQPPREIKGVKGMTSAYKIPEPLEKGILRAKHQIFVFKDGTVRYDSTNMPLTHFRPREVGVSIDKLKKLGYNRDFKEKPLENEDQLLELKVQDIIISRDCAEYLVRVANFLDDLLEKFYHLPRYYNCRSPEDLVGHLVITLSPHTSVGVVARIIGFTDANVMFAHPFLHAARRRDCDGDQDSVMLLLDGLLNFSRRFLPEKRGGTMDAPLMLTYRVDPLEVDKEAHHVEVNYDLPLEFYEQAAGKNPSELLHLVKVVEQNLHSEQKYQIGFMFDTSGISNGPLNTTYKVLQTMEEKAWTQLELAKRIRAVDEHDVARRLIEHHFIPDIRGNLRAFASQKFRCTSCNKKYRRVPLSGVCECGGNLVLTVSQGGIKKYLQLAVEIAKQFDVGEYLKQRVELLAEEIKSTFSEGGSKQLSLADFLV